MAYNTITSGEVDYKSPMNAALWGKVKDNFDAIHDGSGVLQGGLKTTTEEESVSVNYNSFGNTTFSSVGTYGFYPQVKGGASFRAYVAHGAHSSYATMVGFYNQAAAGTHTFYAQIRYVQASRNEPVVYIRQHKETGEVTNIHFDPECSGYGHPWQEMENSEYNIYALELKRDPELCKHLYENYGKAGESWCWQIELALVLGALKMGNPIDPLLPDMSAEQRKALAEMGLDKSHHVSRTAVAPALYAEDVNVIDFTFDKNKLKGE